MFKFLRDLGVGTIFLRFLLVRLHYIALFILFMRILFAEGFPNSFDKLMILYIVGALVYRHYYIRRQTLIIQRFLKGRLVAKDKDDSEKVANE